MRKFSGVIAVALLVAACGGAGAVGTDPEPGSGDTTEAPGTQPGVTQPGTSQPGTSQPDGSQPQGTTATTDARNDGPAAPDFTLALGEGGTYTLSEGAKPVYLIFWAEW